MPNVSNVARQFIQVLERAGLKGAERRAVGSFAKKAYVAERRGAQAMREAGEAGVKRLDRRVRKERLIKSRSFQLKKQPKFSIYKRRGPKLPVGGTPASDVYGSKGVSAFRASPATPKPRTRLTSKQWSALIERITLRETQKPTAAMPQGAYEGILPATGQGAAESFMSSGAPMTERSFARLEQPVYKAGEYMGYKTEDRPLGEAILKLANLRRQGVEGVRTPKVPDVNILSMGGREGPSHLGHGVSYERRIFKDIKGQTERAGSAADVVKQEVEAEAQRAAQVKLRKDAAVRAGVEGAQDQTIQKLDINTMTQQAYVLDNMYKYFIRRKNTDAGRLWTRLMEKSPGRAGKKGKGFSKMDLKDYFQRVGLRYFNDPEKARKTYKMECNLLDEMWAQYQDLLGGVK